MYIYIYTYIYIYVYIYLYIYVYVYGYMYFRNSLKHFPVHDSHVGPHSFDKSAISAFLCGLLAGKKMDVSKNWRFFWKEAGSAFSVPISLSNKLEISNLCCSALQCVAVCCSVLWDKK